MSSPPVPPRFVPTLTEVVRPSAAPTPEPSLRLPLQQGVLPAGAVLEEQLVRRVLQRVDIALDRRLREAIGQLILAHTQTLASDLREEIEQVVRQSVRQAFEQEQAQEQAREP